MPTLTYGSSLAHEEPPRRRWQPFKRGFAGRCPACGEGRIFRKYLKVAESCTSCGEELHHQRADDAPPYFTILIVGHIVGTLLLIGEERWPDAPMWMPIAAGLVLAIALSLALLPRVKGALIGWQWALRMHGFGGTPVPSELADAI
ncbi:MAG TPA: DUF983 domain-containing protein [Beijerinckiaceae bacterium]|jgi:uncharacterized protein (DUF983 family)|nr:DUF983 domain-containing protein [Beijerinckiaceae bacterium]